MTNRSILITGASKGIGRALTERLTATGYRVIGVARKADPTFPGELIELDLADPVATAAALRDIVARRSIYGVVNNVGVARPQPLGAVGLADLTAVLDLNLRPALQAVQAALPGMQAAGLGRIVNISSLTVLGVVQRQLCRSEGGTHQLYAFVGTGTRAHGDNG